MAAGHVIHRGARAVHGRDTERIGVAMLPNVGPLELAVVVIIAVIILGPKRLPEVGRSVGHGIREFKGSISGKTETPALISEDADPPRSPEPALEGEISSRGPRSASMAKFRPISPRHRPRDDAGPASGAL
jgi:sec-independent protein translocase protein TatA